MLTFWRKPPVAKHIAETKLALQRIIRQQVAVVETRSLTHADMLRQRRVDICAIAL